MSYFLLLCSRKTHKVILHQSDHSQRPPFTPRYIHYPRYPPMARWASLVGLYNRTQICLVWKFLFGCISAINCNSLLVCSAFMPLYARFHDFYIRSFVSMCVCWRPDKANQRSKKEVARAKDIARGNIKVWPQFTRGYVLCSSICSHYRIY